VVTPRLGAYVLTGDPVWLRSSLARYYPLLDRLVVLVPEDGVGWTGKRLPVEECLAAVADVDVRGLAERVSGRWRNDERPMAADTAQRQAGIDALSADVDWVIQIDNDELLPDPDALVAQLALADEGTVGIEWPMHVLYRRVGHHYLGVAGRDGRPVYEYPGSVAVRAGATLVDARRVSGRFRRLVVEGDAQSLQLVQPPGPDESRVPGVAPDQAIVHNSWAKSPTEVWRKTRSWGHSEGWRSAVYYATRWLPAPLTWRWARDLHPFADGLWPRVVPTTVPDAMLAPADRPTTRTAWRTRAGR
jgi:hypothetical protein